VARQFATEHWREQAKLEWAAAGACNASFLLIGDPAYPALLREIPDAPLVLYYQGNATLLQGPCIGVVGARDCTHEGLAVTAFFSRALSKAGIGIASGMARGIDRAAHLAALEEMGRSIGVLGAGVDITYPACNADLHALMAEKGLIISEYAPGTPPLPGHFPVRNRLISGLSRGILVVEAANRSGSLVTARLALEQGRDVFAVPGHTMAAVSGGCRELIRRGAKAVFNADDMVVELAPRLTRDARPALKQRQRENATQKHVHAKNRKDEPYEGSLADALNVLPQGTLPWAAPRLQSTDSPVKLSAEEKHVMHNLSAQPRHIDEIAQATGLEVAKLSGLLTFMEIRGLLRHLPGMLYVLPDTAER
jgi:DNA processing protein